MKKNKKLIVYGVLLILITGLFIYLKDYHGYVFLNKEVEFDGISFNINFKYKNKDISGGLQPQYEYECLINYNIKIDGKVVKDQVKELGEEMPVVFKNIYVIKDFENEDFISYCVVAQHDKKNGDISLMPLTKYLVIKSNNKRYVYDNWYKDLPYILNNNGLTQYNKNNIGTIDENLNKPWNEIFEILPKK